MKVHVRPKFHLRRAHFVESGEEKILTGLSGDFRQKAAKVGGGGQVLTKKTWRELNEKNCLVWGESLGVGVGAQSAVSGGKERAMKMKMRPTI